MLFALIVFLCIAVPIAELWFLLLVADWLGGGARGAALTIGLIVIDSLLGAMLLRSQGRLAWARFVETVAARRMPHREVIDGMFVAVGGALILAPGFLTDLVGLVMLLPPSRKVLAGVVNRSLAKRVRLTGAVNGFSRQSEGTSGAGSAPSDDSVVDGVAFEEEIDFEFEQKRLDS